MNRQMAKRNGKNDFGAASQGFMPSLNGRLTAPYKRMNRLRISNYQPAKRSRRRERHCIQRTVLAYYTCNILDASSIGRSHRNRKPSHYEPSDRPEQFLQCEQVSGLSAASPSMQMCRKRIAWRDEEEEAPMSRPLFNVKSLSTFEYPNPSKRLRTRRGIPAVMKALGPSRVVFAKSRHHVTESR